MRRHIFSASCGLLAALGMALTIPTAASATVYQAEQATMLGGAKIDTSLPGYSGKGYVDNITGSADGVSFNVTSPSTALYTLSIRYASPAGDKGFNLSVNGFPSNGMFTKTGNDFSSLVYGPVPLTRGANTIAISGGWAWYDINSIQIDPFTRAPLLKPSAVPSDPKAEPCVKRLMRFLVQNYGVKTLSGQKDMEDTATIQKLTGKTPAIFATDLSYYSPNAINYGANPGTTVEDAIKRAKVGQILSLSWHWYSPTGIINSASTPWWKGFYTDGTTYDVSYALANPASPEHAAMIRDIDAIAVQLKKVDAAGYPILWRPLHESEGGWFWWGAKGPAAFVQLWQLVYNRLTTVDNVHNLIWCYTGDANSAWYPGDAYVDIVGSDQYPANVEDPLIANWTSDLARYNGHKLIALSEIGDVPDVDEMSAYNVQWSFFDTWSGFTSKTSNANLQRIYSSNRVINCGVYQYHAN